MRVLDFSDGFSSSAAPTIGNFIFGFASTVTAAGTTTLTSTSAYLEQFTGTTTQTVVLPDATTLSIGASFSILNRSTGAVTVNANGGGLVIAVPAASQVIVTCTSVGTSPGVWDVSSSGAGVSLAGDVTGLSGSNTVAQVGGQLAAAVAASAVLANAATNLNTASAIMKRDANKNVLINNIVESFATTVTAAGTTTLTASSAYTQQFTGATTQIVVLPDATTLSLGHSFSVLNRSTGIVTVNANGGGLAGTVAASSQAVFTVTAIGTAAGTWDLSSSGAGITLAGDVTGAPGSNTVAQVASYSAANVAAGATLANAATNLATASAIVKRDTNKNAIINNLIESFTSTVTAAGTTTLTVGSSYIQQFTGTSTQTVVMPDATTLTVGQSFSVLNRSTGIVTVNANGGTLISTVAAAAQTVFTVTAIGTTAGTWDVASSSAGATSTSSIINYISASDGSAIGSWAAYANAAGTSPVNGTGGSPASTFAVSTDSSLVGPQNFLWTKSAANRQGEGFSYPFTIDAGYQSKPMTITALYKIASGTYVDGDMTVWVYDVTNSVLIQPSGYSILNSTGTESIKASFQSASNSTSYRLIVHTASVSALAYSIRFDQFSVAPNTYNAGAVITAWQAYTPTYTGFGTVATSNMYWRRDGDSLQVQGSFVLGTATAVNATVSLPAGLVIDTAQLSATASSNVFGYAARASSAAQTFAGINVGPWPIIDRKDLSTTAVYISQGATGNLYTAALGNNVGISGEVLNVQFTLKIAGWGTSQVLSSDTDTRVCAAFANNIAGGAYTGGSVFPFTNVLYDSHSAFSAGTYTIPVAGTYVIAATIYNNVAAGANYAIKKNGTALTTAYTGGTGAGASISVCPTTTTVCKAGDTITVVGSASSTLDAATTEYSLSILRLSGPAQVAASEKIYCQYTGNAGTALTANVTNIDFSTKVVDSHGAWNGTTFTAPRAGWYNVAGGLFYSTSALRDAYIYVNGVQKTIVQSAQASTNVYGLAGGVYLNGGDLLTFRTDTGGTLSNSAINHCIAITSQG